MPSVDWQAKKKEAAQLLNQQRFAEARTSFAELSQLGGEAGLDGTYGLGVVALQQGETETAKHYLNEVLKQAPHHQNALYYLGITAEKQEMKAQASDYYQKVVALNPSHGGAVARLSALHVHNGVASQATPQVLLSNIEQQRGSQGPPVPPQVRLRPGVGTATDQPLNPYEFLKKDASLAARQAQALLDLTQFDVRPRISAHIGMLPMLLPSYLGYGVRILFLLFVIGFLCVTFYVVFVQGILSSVF